MLNNQDITELAMIPWNASDFIGYSEAEIKLINIGFNFALNQVYLKASLITTKEILND